MRGLQSLGSTSTFSPRYLIMDSPNNGHALKSKHAKHFYYSTNSLFHNRGRLYCSLSSKVYHIFVPWRGFDQDEVSSGLRFD